MTTFPTARATRPVNPPSVAARTLTDVMRSETCVPDLLAGLEHRVARPRVGQRCVHDAARQPHGVLLERVGARAHARRGQRAPLRRQPHPRRRQPGRRAGRNVLEWRFDPRSKARIEQAAYGARVIARAIAEARPGTWPDGLSS
ncbi:MAG: hypothetical protein ABIR39_04500 [Nocardioides sp.]|uniref:hypothetical protein n=1 Tax=Nocardioides sp. TaxID=35761 RepID=UPI003266ECD0